MFFIRIVWSIMEVVIKGDVGVFPPSFHLYSFSQTSLRGSVRICNDDLCGILVKYHLKT